MYTIFSIFMQYRTDLFYIFVYLILFAISYFNIVVYVWVTPYKETIVPLLVATLIYLAQNYSYHIRGDRSPLIFK